MAQPRELLLFMEVPTVVTATGREQLITEAPSAITLITADDIRQSGATSIADLLRFVPGLDFFRTSASHVNVAARGLNRDGLSRMQVLVDGLSVYEDVLSTIYWHQIPIPLEEIERIEIVRSPATALYGDKAFAGVVHIITKSPEALKGTHLSGTVGEARTGIGNLIHAGVDGNLSYKVSVGYDTANQFENPGVGRTSDQEGRTDKRAHFQVNYKLPRRSKVSLSGGIDEFDRREIFSPGPGQFVVVGWLGFLKANYELGDFKVQLSYNRLEADVTSALFVKDAVAVADVYQAKLQDSAALAEGNVLTGGFTYRFARMDSQEFLRGQQGLHTLGIFLQDEWRLRENLTLTIAAGTDVHPEAGLSISPRATLVYSPWKNHTARVSTAAAFRNPSFLENFEALPVTVRGFPELPFKILGNPDLEPEEMISYEVGYQALLFDRLRARIDLFYNQVDDLTALRRLVFAPPGAFPTALQVVNFEGGDIYGAELEFNVFVTSWLKGFVNYSYQERSGDVSLMGLASNHKGNAGLTFSLLDGLSATVLVHHTNVPENPSTGLDPYTIVNMRLGYRFKGFGNETEVAIQAFNLFNDRHREFPGGDLIERRMSGTVRVRF